MNKVVPYALSLSLAAAPATAEIVGGPFNVLNEEIRVNVVRELTGTIAEAVPNVNRAVLEDSLHVNTIPLYTAVMNNPNLRNIIWTVDSTRAGNDLTLKIIELTEAATVTEHQGQGLYSAVATKGLVELAKGSVPFIKDGVDLVYGECNGHNQGVLKAARYQGRTFAAEAAQKMKLPFNGLLLQHVPIFGSSKISEYNNLLPAFLSRATLNEFAKG